MQTDYDWIAERVTAIHEVAVGAPGDNALDALEKIASVTGDLLHVMKGLRESPTGTAQLAHLRRLLGTTCDLLDRAWGNLPPLTASRDAITDARSCVAAIDTYIGGNREALAGQLAETIAQRDKPTGAHRLEELRVMVNRVAAILGDAVRHVQFQSDAHNAITDARCRVADIASYVHGDDAILAGQLADVIAIRNVGTPDAPDPYPATTTDVAAEILKFIDGDGAARGIRLALREQLEADAAREAAERHRERIVSVMRDVATQHLHPALRALGIDNPEDVWELRGKWQEEVPGDS